MLWKDARFLREHPGFKLPTDRFVHEGCWGTLSARGEMRKLVTVGLTAAVALGTASATNSLESDPPRVLRVVCDDNDAIPTSWTPLVEIQRRGVHLQIDHNGQDSIYFRRPDNIGFSWSFGWGNEPDKVLKRVFPGRLIDEVPRKYRPRNLVGRWRFGCFTGRFNTRDYRNRELARVTLVNEIP